MYEQMFCKISIYKNEYTYSVFVLGLSFQYKCIKYDY